MIRGPRRRIISRCYNLLLHATLGTGFSDAQCGFKAIRADAARVLLPLTQDSGWFFDTELLVLAERAGLRIHEVPVDWIDDSDSRVKLAATAVADLRGIARLGTGLARGTIRVPVLGDPAPPGSRPATGAPGRGGGLAGQLARFTVVGVACTVAYVLLFLLLRGVVGAQGANAVSLLVTAVVNTAANRRVTFGIRGRARAGRHQVRGLIAFGIGLALTSAALAVLHHAGLSPGRTAEVSVLVAANLLATIIRFGLYRSWVFRGGPADQQTGTRNSSERNRVRPSPGSLTYPNGNITVTAVCEARFGASAPLPRPPHGPPAAGQTGRPGLGEAWRCWPCSWPPRCSISSA